MTRADALLMGAILIGLPWLYVTFWSSAGAGQQLHILTGGDTERIVPLAGDRSLSIEGVLGESIVRIENGKARFIHSPCSNQACVRQGWVVAAGEVAACLPNRISIQVLGREPRFDAINF